MSPAPRRSAGIQRNTTKCQRPAAACGCTRRSGSSPGHMASTRPAELAVPSHRSEQAIFGNNHEQRCHGESHHDPPPAAKQHDQKRQSKRRDDHDNGETFSQTANRFAQHRAGRRRRQRHYVQSRTVLLWQQRRARPGVCKDNPRPSNAAGTRRRRSRSSCDRRQARESLHRSGRLG
jgi:hypothetical protein